MFSSETLDVQVIVILLDKKVIRDFERDFQGMLEFLNYFLSIILLLLLNLSVDMSLPDHDFTPLLPTPMLGP